VGFHIQFLMHTKPKLKIPCMQTVLNETSLWRA